MPQKVVEIGVLQSDTQAHWVPLHKMSPNRCGVIARVDTEGSLADQLKCMGVCSGRKIEVIKQGDPLILKVLATRIGVSARLAEQVYIDPCSNSECVS